MSYSIRWAADRTDWVDIGRTFSTSETSTVDWRVSEDMGIGEAVNG
jgi:hypothetical protein